MWCDHAFSQRKKAIKRVGSKRRVGNIGEGGLYKIEVTLCQLYVSFLGQKILNIAKQ